MNNLFNKTGSVESEIIEKLIDKNNVKIERIISFGQSSPENFWYDQESDEWVVLLTGSAGLQFECDAEEKILKPGDYVFIPAHLKHRINWTEENKNTIWLAIFF